MATVKHPDTYTCDICGTEFDEKRRVNVPVLWVTEQNEGRSVKPYFGTKELDLCEACTDKVHVVEAAGACGVNNYRFRKELGNA